MSKINFDKKTFMLLNNSTNGEVDDQTIFDYKQDGDLVTADYYGGTIIYGKIIAHLENDSLHMLYNCLTTEKKLKSGKATAQVTLNIEGKILLHLDWQWLETENHGKSTYIEI